MFWERGNGYGIELEEYEGKFQLVEAKKKDDNIYKEWNYISEWDAESRSFVPGEKKRPQGIRLGEEATALSVLSLFMRAIIDDEKELVRFLQNWLGELGASSPAPGGGDIPF